MASHSFDKPDVHSLNASLRGEVLHELGEIVSKLANAQIDGFTTRLSDALLHASQSASDPQEAKLSASAASLLKRNRYPFYYVVSERLSMALQHELAAAADPLGVHTDTSGALKALPPELEVDKKLCLIKASRAIEAENNARLTALNIRLASLLERPDLSTAQNPFRPQVFLTVIHDAWCEFQPDTATHHLVYRLLGSDVCLDLAPVLHALNMALIKRGIVPHIAASELLATIDAEKITVSQEEVVDDPLVQQLRRLFPAEPIAPEIPVQRQLAGDFPSLFQEDAVQAKASRNELLGFLTSVQRTVSMRAPSTGSAAVPHQVELFAQIKQKAPVASLTASDENVLQLLAKIFGVVFTDKHIADEMKFLIGSLQVPILKVAVLDKNFFFKEHHPARRVIDLLTKLSVGWDRSKGQADPLFAMIQRCVKRIQQESEQHVSVFADVLVDLDAYVKRDETASAQALSMPIANAVQHEKHQEAHKAARNEVALRVGTGEVVAFVETFLEDKWVAVLTLAYTVKDDKPQAVDSAIKTMDDLCWSVKPKITAAERKELLAKLPSMVAMLNKWLDLIKWNDAERTRFFKELAECHASIVRAPLELSPERQVQIALSIAKKAAERRLQRQARQQPEPEPDEFAQAVDKLERGTWIEFKRTDGIALKVKLAWVSPMRSLFIFSTRERQEALSISAEALAQQLRDERARIVSLSGLVGRVLASALGVDSANAADMEAKSAA